MLEQKSNFLRIIHPYSEKKQLQGMLCPLLHCQHLTQFYFAGLDYQLSMLTHSPLQTKASATHCSPQLLPVRSFATWVNIESKGQSRPTTPGPAT